MAMKNPLRSLPDEVEIAQAVFGNDGDERAVQAAQAVVKGACPHPAGDVEVAAYVQAALDATAPEAMEEVEKKFSFGDKEPGTFDQCVLFQQKVRGYGEERARRICGAIQTRQEVRKAAKPDRDAMHEAAEARAKKYGIPMIEGGHLTPPKGNPTEESEHGDPSNFLYPLHDKAHADNAAARFAQNHDRYPESAQKVIYERIVRAQLKHGSSPDPAAEMLALLPESLREKLKGMTKMADDTSVVKMNACEPYSPHDGADAKGPYTLKVTAVTRTTHGEKEQKEHKHYDLSLDVGDRDLYVATVMSESDFAVGDLVSVQGTGVSVYASVCNPLVLGPGKGAVTKLADVLPSHVMQKGALVITAHGNVGIGSTPVLTFTASSSTVSSTPSSTAPVEVGAAVEKAAPFRRFVPFAKRTITDAKREIGGVFYPADKLDAHREYASAEDLRKAAHDWLTHSRVFNAEHTDVVLSGVKPAESYIAKTTIPEWDAQANDWVGVAKVDDDGTWADIENGVYKGFSIEGISDKVQEAGKRRLTKILVTRVSLVREPATMMEFTAKNVGAMPREETMSATNPVESSKVSLDPVKAGLDRLQGTATELVDAVGARRPEPLVLFKAYNSPDEQRVALMEDQIGYVERLLKVVHTAAKEREETFAKAMVVIAAQKGAIDGLKDKIAAYETHPDISKVARDLEGATA